MDMIAIKDLLAPWIQVDTWHTSNRHDITRFNRSLKVVFIELGYSISRDQFHSAISELISELHPGFDEDYKKIIADEYSAKAESIAEYLNDTE